jgi:hypothetical protein
MRQDAIRSERIESTINVLAAILVLFTAMLDPVVSVVLAVVFLLALALFKLNSSRGM